MLKSKRARTRRTTLTLPAEILNQVERLARNRHQTLSSTVAVLLQEALRTYALTPNRERSIFEALQRSFGSLTEEEQMLVDGIVLTKPDTES